MITVRREWMAKSGQLPGAIENAKAYRDKFGDSSWRITTPNSGIVYTLIVDEDYESLAEAEKKWAERAATPEFGPWLEEWFGVSVGNSLAFSYFRRH